MGIDLYYMPRSPPCCAVRLVAAAIGVELNLKLIDLRGKEHQGPDFLKINPQHTIPTLVDDGFCLWESRSIARYLVNKYGAGSSLYPGDPQARALVDQRLDFDTGTLHPAYEQYFYPIVKDGATADPAKRKKLEEALGFLNIFLEGREYVAGPSLTLADLSLVSTVMPIVAAGTNFKPFPNIVKWYKLIQSNAPQYEDINRECIEAYNAAAKRFEDKLNMK